MRRLTAWIGGVAAGVVAYRFWHRRPQAAAEPSLEPTTEEQDDRADELRAKLAESRVEGEPPPAEPEQPSEAVEERRRRVHEEGRAALDDMKPDESA
jgi:hypothetical protein